MWKREFGGINSHCCYGIFDYKLFRRNSGIMATCRLTDVIQRFNGSGDVAVWMRQVKLASELLNVEDAAKIIPLFLEGDAFAIYEDLSEADKKDKTKIEEALVRAFGLDPFRAYEQFSRRTLQSGECVDAYLMDLKRLAGLAKIKSDALIRVAFTVGLPKRVSTLLRAYSNVNEMTLEAIASTARSLVEDLKEEDPVSQVGAVGSQRGRFQRRCYVCGGPHLQRFCPKKQGNEKVEAESAPAASH